MSHWMWWIVACVYSYSLVVTGITFMFTYPDTDGGDDDEHYYDGDDEDDAIVDDGDDNNEHYDGKLCIGP